MKNTIIESILKNKIVAIIRGVKKEKLVPLCNALYEGGIRLVEVTYGKETDENTAEMIKLLSEEFKGRMYVGAGTVLTEKQVELTKNSGGQFIISPDTYKEVIEKTNELNMVSIPGALTPTEIRNAVRYGADFVKLFPITNLGSGYVKAVKAPLSDVKMLAVGGINENNMEEYEKAGVCGFGVGSNIIDKKAIDNDDFDKIKELALSYTKNI